MNKQIQLCDVDFYLRGVAQLQTKTLIGKYALRSANEKLISDGYCVDYVVSVTNYVAKFNIDDSLINLLIQFLYDSNRLKDCIISTTSIWKGDEHR